jgi:hypothetical protein
MAQLDQMTAQPQHEVDAAPGGSAAWPLWPFLAALVAAPLLALAGLALEPPGAYGSERNLVEAYVESPGRVDLQATGLHLGYVLAGFGLFGAGAAVRGRGRRLAVTGGFLSLLGFGFMSSFLLMDWVTIAVGEEAGVGTALRVDAAIGGPAFVAAWIVPQMLGLVLGPPLVVAGLARAGLLPWPAMLLLPAAFAPVPSDSWGPVVGVALYGALCWWIAGVLRRRAGVRVAARS